MAESAGFVPPPYPYDRLDRLVPLARRLDGGVVDLSIGTPCDPPLDSVIAALSTSNAERSKLRRASAPEIRFAGDPFMA